MRYYTYSVGAQLIRELMITGTACYLLHDGGDLIQIELASGEDVLIYLIERPIPTYEVQHILEENSAAGVYTLFLLWCEMLLPDDGNLFAPDEWMQTLMAVYGDQIYGYDVYMGHLLVFPVHFEATTNYFQRMIRHGDPVDVRWINCLRLETRHPGIVGTWHVATFDGLHQQRSGTTRKVIKVDLLAVHYAALGIEREADRVEVKRAYRHLARQFHPDLNSKHGAKEQMQRINLAYDTIMKALDEDE